MNILTLTQTEINETLQKKPTLEMLLDNYYSKQKTEKESKNEKKKQILKHIEENGMVKLASYFTKTNLTIWHTYEKSKRSPRTNRKTDS